MCSGGSRRCMAARWWQAASGTAAWTKLLGTFRRAQMLGLILPVGSLIRRSSTLPTANMRFMKEQSAGVWEELEGCSDVGR